MKKFAKMSLVAAVAVAGLTNVSAASLEEAIKGVDVSGNFRFRAEERSSSDTWTDVEIEIGAKVPVNDNVTAVFKIDNANNDTEGVTTKGSVDIEDYYFSYLNGALTVNAGQQNIPGRITDGAQGDGLVALFDTGSFVVAGASFMNTTITSEMLNSILVMGSVGPVSLLAQYANVDDVLDTYNVKADATVGPAKVGVEYVTTDLDGTSGDYETLKAYASAKVGPVKAKLTYAKTGDDGSGSTHAVATGSYGDSVETPSEFLLWQTGSATKDDYEVIALDASIAVNDKVSVRAAYADGEDSDVDFSEVIGQVGYQMSKNLNSYFRYSQLDVDGSDKVNRGRIEVKYTF